MAEHTMGLLLALARNFPDSVRGAGPGTMGLSRKIWDKPQHLTELNEKVLLIVGYGPRSGGKWRSERKHLT